MMKYQNEANCKRGRAKLISFLLHFGLIEYMPSFIVNIGQVENY